ncbi:MAG: hypothetical protein H6843_14125 [Rhodospirillaceae bacterium]|nr:hypothetical protein [Rhodospirillaceae bacterium]
MTMHAYPGGPNFGGPYPGGQGHAAGNQMAAGGPGHAGLQGPVAAPGVRPATMASAVGQAPGLLNNKFLTGMLVGGALTYVLSNEAVQRAAIRTVAQVWLGIKGGLEETKERFRDAESEIRSAHEK